MFLINEIQNCKKKVIVGGKITGKEFGKKRISACGARLLWLGRKVWVYGCLHQVFS